MQTLNEIAAAVQNGSSKDVAHLVEKALDEGINAQTILDKALIETMTIVGEDFSKNVIFVPDMLAAARGMAAGVNVLAPYLAEEGNEPIGHAVIGTVMGDLHDMGKNLVRVMLEGKGFEVEDLGVDVAPKLFVDYLKEHPECRLVCLSSLLTTTLPMIPATIEAIKKAGLRSRVIIMVGGAPVTQELADEIGADGYAPDAGQAAELAVTLVAK